MAQAEVLGGGNFNFQRMSNGQTVTLDHFATGQYIVSFPGMGDPQVFDQTVQVTPYNISAAANWRSCGVGSRSIFAGTRHVTVVCVNNGFVVANTGFFIMVTG